MTRIFPFIRAGIKAVAGNLFAGYKSPIGVYFTITSRCNLNCNYCDYSKLNQKGYNEIPLDLCKKYIDEMAAMGVVKLNITGGEPLLHPDIDEIICYSKKKKMFVALSTNGLLVEKHIESLKNVDVVMLSFDGKKENHNIMRGAESYEKVIETMEIMRKNRINFWTTTTLNKNNINDIEFILDTAAEFGVYSNFVLLQFFENENCCNSLPDYEKIKQLFPEEEDIRAAFDRLIQLKKNGKAVGSTYGFLKFMRDWKDYKILMSNQKYGVECYAGKLYCHLYVDKKMYACGHCIGNIEGIDIEKYGFAESFKQLQKIENCNSCRVACDTENNLIYNLNLSAIWNWLKKM